MGFVRLVYLIWTLGLLSVVTLGCSTRELVLESADAPWERATIARVCLPAFEGPAQAWLLADQLREIVRLAVVQERVVVDENAAVTLAGAVTEYVRSAIPGAPRRVRRPATGAVLGDQDVWEVDYTHRVTLSVVLRLVDEHGQPIWSKAFLGTREESQTVVVPWPGSDPLPPPAQILNRSDDTRLTDLTAQALADLRDGLRRAIAAHYTYKVVS